jgi:hypothetical protein
VVEWGRLLSGYRGEIFGRRFESCPPRLEQKRVRMDVFLFMKGIRCFQTMSSHDDWHYVPMTFSTRVCECKHK